jgi:hypothetical protein
MEDIITVIKYNCVKLYLLISGINKREKKTIFRKKCSNPPCKNPFIKGIIKLEPGEIPITASIPTIIKDAIVHPEKINGYFQYSDLYFSIR